MRTTGNFGLELIKVTVLLFGRSEVMQTLAFSAGNKSNGAFSEGHYLVVASHNQVIRTLFKNFITPFLCENKI